MRLTESDRSMLEGGAGPAVQTAMSLLVAAGEAMGATELLDIVGAHIDSCLYHGIAGLDFAQSLARDRGRVRVPTTLNVALLDLLHPEMYKGDPETAANGRALMDAYVAMGCTPTWTCAPYQLLERPALGDQIAWGESNAIVFANSVLGARTNRYGDFLDICCALTGRAPASGLHTDEGRRATLRIDVQVRDEWKDDDLLYPLLGHLLGQLAGTEVAVFTGLDGRADEDRLKALGAASASSGAVGMFHVVGVTPEAADLETACGGRSPGRAVVIDEPAVIEARAALNRSNGPLGAVSVGTPHASIKELRRLSELSRGRRSVVPFFVNTGRDVLEAAEIEGIASALTEFGVSVVTDTCTYLTPIMGDVDGAVMTNSGKWAFYAPGNIGVEVAFGNLDDCVESAVKGEILHGGSL